MYEKTLSCETLKEVAVIVAHRDHLSFHRIVDAGTCKSRLEQIRVSEKDDKWLCSHGSPQEIISFIGLLLNTPFCFQEDKKHKDRPYHIRADCLQECKQRALRLLFENEE